MIEPEQERALGRQRHGSGLGLAVAYYGIVGLIGAALGAWFVFSLVEAILGGYCEIGAPGAVLCGKPLQELLAPSSRVSSA